MFQEPEMQGPDVKGIKAHAVLASGGKMPKPASAVDAVPQEKQGFEFFD
jgi:hypothetical protein